MKVKLISKTFLPEETMYIGARTCYSEESPIEAFYKGIEDGSYRKQLRLIGQAITSGHLTIAEHWNFTFAIEGISRACSHQLVRHRHCCFSQQSQRYVKFDKATFYEPQSILKEREADAIYNQFLDYVQETYNKLIDLGIKAEDARYVLPNATCSNIVVTLNFRELMHLCSLRLCTRSQSEIRELVKLMANEVIIKHPWTEDFLQPKCETLKFCNEHHGCGRKPSLVEMIKDKQNEEK